MSNYKIAFVIDKVELKYFELNELVTSFWLIKECLLRNWKVYITTIDKLTLNNNIPEAELYKTQITELNDKPDLIYDKKSFRSSLNDFDMILFRPDPPVDMNYIFATYILDYVDTSKTTILNSTSGIRKANEKLYINNFPFAVPKNITTANPSLIKEYLEEQNELIIKPLNKCFGKGVFYLQKGDKNINSIIDMATEYGTSVVMAQEYIKSSLNGDKRLIMIGGELFEEAVYKISGAGDFKFNTHKDEYLKKANVTDKEKEICSKIAPKLIEDGLFFVGLDVMDEKIIEINVTSPCFFIKEINNFFNTCIEKRIVDYMESLLSAKKSYSLTSSI